MKRRDFFRSIGAGGMLREQDRLEIACDRLQIDYAEALLENRTAEFLSDLRSRLQKAKVITLRNERLLRGETLKLFQDLFTEYEAKGKRFERRRS